MIPSVVFIQKRTHRAGAQTCLARLLRHAAMKTWSPVLVCSAAGWLTSESEKHGIPVIIEPFPSSRSLGSRLFGNNAWASKVRTRLQAIARQPAIVHANDHLEGLLGLALAKELQARKAIFLRSPGMRSEDLFKYGCTEYDLIAVVGDELLTRNQGWAPKIPFKLVHDGIETGEFAEAKPKPSQFPQRILVIGSALDWKGWADLTEALHLLHEKQRLPELTFDYTGDKPDPAKNDLKLERLPSGQHNFIGRVEGFRELVRGYDLVINPTRMESFGMAAVEVLAAGVPLLTSRTGIIEQVQEDKRFLFQACQPAELAERLDHLIHNWPAMSIDVTRCQQNIRGKFTVDIAMSKLSAEYTRLTA
jgi:glycosyltransferase involved in cell wall biosynthesis